MWSQGRSRPLARTVESNSPPRTVRVCSSRSAGRVQLAVAVDQRNPLSFTPAYCALFGCCDMPNTLSYSGVVAPRGSEPTPSAQVNSYVKFVFHHSYSCH